MRSPRAAYRLVTVLAPVAVIVAIVAAFDGLWLLAGCVALSAAGLLVNRRDMKRKGIDWNGPTTYRELRRARPDRTL